MKRNLCATAYLSLRRGQRPPKQSHDCHGLKPLQRLRRIATGHKCLLKNFPSPGGRGLRGGGNAAVFPPSPYPSPLKGEGIEVSSLNTADAQHRGQTLAMTESSCATGSKRLIQALTTITTVLLICTASRGDIASSKHNLSVTGPGTIKATTETELCVFCHIPHNANPAAPLWNHSTTAATYQMYTSDYLTRAGYATPSDVGQRSRLCLSCHDGTVAIGSVYMLRGQSLSSPIAMSGVAAEGRMPTTAAGFLGTDLRNDHPVSIKYDTGITLNFGSGSRTMELKTPAPPINPKPYQGVKLYGSVSGTIQGYVECSSCHDAHNDANSKFLVVSNAGGALCTSCHNKTGWTGSIHQSSVQAINNPVGETQPIPGTTVAQAACMACHKSHSGQGTPYLARKAEENTCYNGASSSCHGSSGAKNIFSVFNRAKVHPVATSGVHKNLDVLDYTQLGAGNRHAECYDCHNPHQAKNLPHRTAASSWYPATITSTSNLVSNSGALTGATGVAPGTAAIWTARTTFTTKNAATYEYEICYKCHSYYAIRNASTPLAAWAGLSSAYITDQAWEFNPANKSAHPIEVTLNNQTGSSTPKPLAANQLSAPWNTNPGNQTMYCSDCHGADNENSTDPNGPHGSNNPFMLKGPNKTWPGSFTLNNASTGAGTAAGLFCLNCHPMTSGGGGGGWGGGGWLNNVHDKGDHQSSSITCVRCHSAVPHGSRVSRLIAYNSPVPPWGAPYGNQGYLRGFKKASSPTNYSRSNCYSTASACSDHNRNDGGYDP